MNINFGKKQKNSIRILMLSLIFLLILITFQVSITLGSSNLSLKDTFLTLIGLGTDKSNFVIFELRMPRMLLALMIGAGLGVAGAIMQAVTQNDLAEPGILGINAGAGLGVVLYILFIQGNSYDALSSIETYILPLAALLGGLLASFCMYLFSWKKGISPIRLILVGVAVNAGFSAVLILFQLKLDDSDFQKATIWLSGSIWVSNWTYVLALLPWLLILIPYVFYKARILNILALGDTLATGLGTAVEKERIKLLIAAVALTGVSVSVGGGIAFIGLLAPHLVKRLVGVKHQLVIPGSALMGALLVLLSDTIGKNLLSPSEIPVGLVIGIIGAPYFIYLLMKNN